MLYYTFGFSVSETSKNECMNFLLRFSSVAGYSCAMLTGASFFSLVHTADIGPVSKAFKNCKYFSDKSDDI